MENKLTREQVFAAIVKERGRQDTKFGADKQQSVAGFLLVLEAELQEAKDGWKNGRIDEHAPLNEILQVAAVAVACLEKYGVSGNVVPADDQYVGSYEDL